MGADPAVLDGDLHLVPFSGGNIAPTVASHLQRLATEHGVDSVLILKRFPTGIDTLADELADRIDRTERPKIDALTNHARRVVQSQDQSPTILSDKERHEIGRRFIRDYEWETRYLRKARHHESFGSDINRLLNVVAWWGLPIETSDPVLAEIVDAADEFREQLDNHGYLQRGDLVARAAELLASNQTVQERVTSRFDCVLVVEFEEFGPIERQYLSHLTTDAELVSVGEADSSVQRIWNEPGDIENLVNGMSVTGDARRQIERPLDALSNFLATGAISSSHGPPGTVQVIDEATFERQVRTVADEIERLREEHGWAYDEFAVGFKFSRGPIPETLRILRQAGIPTTSATVSGFGDDPAIRELLALSRFLATGSEEERSRLKARVSTLDDETLATVRAEPALELALRKWALETDLKERIAATESTLEARAQFNHVRDVFDLAAFVDETPLIEDDWESFGETLEGAFGNAAAETTTGATNVKGDGVLVDAVRVMKNASWKAVFMLNVVEGEYPARPGLTRLIPDSRLAALPEYPGVTNPTAEEVRDTFATAPADIDRPYYQYYEELARRLLAVGSRAATERLYYGIYEEADATTGKRTQPSRFLTAAYEEFPWIGTLDHDEVHGQSGATRFALSRVDRALGNVKRAEHTGHTVDIADVERDLGAIQHLLDEDLAFAERLAQAVTARIDFAAGRVRNE